MNSRMVLAIVIAVVSVLAGASAQLDPLVGPTAAKAIVSVCNLATAILASVSAVMSTQTNQVAAVTAMPGVSKVLVNNQATQNLAQMVVDQDSQNARKVEAVEGSEKAVAAIAAGNDRIVDHD